MHDLLSQPFKRLAPRRPVPAPPLNETARKPLLSNKVDNVLFVWNHNAARSIMAEGLLNSLGKDHFKADSAGSQPAGTVNPFALKTLTALHIQSGARKSDGHRCASP